MLEVKFYDSDIVNGSILSYKGGEAFPGIKSFAYI